jgi:hypothetical protein
MHVYRNATAVIDNDDTVIAQYLDVYLVAVTSQGFVYAVIDHLIDQMMKTLHSRVPDVHGGSFPNGREPFENSNGSGAICFL